MAQDDDVVEEMRSAAKVIPFPGAKYIPLADAASYIKSFVRADILKILYGLREEASITPITEEQINRLIEHYAIH